MTSCSHCGTESASLFCPSCGTRKGAPAAMATAVGEVVRVHEGPEGTLVHQAPIQAPAMQPQQGFVPSVPVQRQVTTYAASELAGTIQDIGKNKVTGHAAWALNKSDEAMAWQGSPSIYVLIPLALKYAGGLFVTLILFRSLGLSFLLLLSAAIHLGLRYYEITQTKYRLSSQRLEITAGVLNSVTVTHEVHQLGNAVIFHPFYLKHFNLANVSIANGPTLVGVENADVIRDIIREFGQTEASRTDKVRWRS